MGQRIKDLGSVSTTATLDRADADLFKMTTSDALTLTLSNFEDGDMVTLAVAFTGASARVLSFSNTLITTHGTAFSLTTSETTYVTFVAFDGALVELNRATV